MLMGQELVYALVVPAVVAGVIAALGRWRRWGWAMPVGVGVGFLTGYALFRMPALPPRDGVDWLFWLTLPVTAAGVAASMLARADEPEWRGRLWLSPLGLAAAVVSLAIMLPLTRVGSVSVGATVWTPLAVGLIGAGSMLALQIAIDRVGPVAVMLGLCIIVGGAGVMVMSSNLRIVGIYGLAAAAAVGAVGILCWDRRGAAGVGVLAISLLAGLLSAGTYYPDPGVRWWEFALIFCAPLLMAAVAFVPVSKGWIKGVIAVGVVALFVGALTIPKALAAKKAAEGDPYGGMYQ
jgi:hypothetical protein